MSFLTLLFLIMSAIVATAALLLLRQSFVHSEYLRKPSLSGAEMVRGIQTINRLAHVAFWAASMGLFVVAALSLDLKRYGSWTIPAAIGVGCFVGYMAPALFDYLRIKTYLLSFWENVTLPPNSGRTTPYFLGLYRPRLFNNRIYLLYLAEPMLCGAVVRNRTLTADKPGAHDYNPELWVDQEMELLYDRINLTGPIFLALNEGNFQLGWHDISHIDYDTDTNRWWRYRNHGRLTIHPKEGLPRAFILVGLGDGDGLKAVLDGILAAGTARDIPVGNPGEDS